MNVICEECKSKFRIPDEKVPAGKVFSVACPKCKNKIAIDARSDTPKSPENPPPPAPEAKPGPEKTIIDEVASGTYDASEKPFDFIEEGAQTALLCEPDPTVRDKIRTALENMDYHITESNSAREVLKRMRFHIFDIVVLNERFDTSDPDTNTVLKYLDRLSMETRRNMFVTLITDRFRTNDNMAAFNKSVNLIVNLTNIDEMEKILNRGVVDCLAFYSVFKEALTKTGRA